jgi:hypothetical protein
MNNDVILLQETLEKIQVILSRKNNEYAREHPLSNFVRAGAAFGKAPIEALAGFVLKHFISFLDYAKDETNGVHHTPEEWDEKIIDIMCYMALARAIVRHRNELSNHA